MKLNKKVYKMVLVVALIAVMLFWLSQLNWSNVLSKENSGAILGVLAPLMILISFQLQNKKSKK